jgi:hypothetical protein
MTTAIEGSELTQTGPGSVMGDLMRQYSRAMVPRFA